MSSANSSARIAIQSLGRRAAANKKRHPSLRSAGRGQSAATQSKPSSEPSSGFGRGGGASRLAKLSRQSRSAPPQRTAGRGEPRSAAPRSTLAQSVLKRRGERRDEIPAMSLKPRNENGPAARGREGARKIEDWYSSSARKEALESMKDLSRSLSVADTEMHRPFAWADFEKVVEQLPDQHWAEPFVQGVVRNLEANPAVDGKEKERILGSILQTLSDLSTEDERYQDAEG
ncbi:hypothetical protein FGB62_112g26 [Gracilaria domingensis]|nr:hypothetical protein FGB62_112g26 [Gracilaria domingensis]